MILLVVIVNTTFSIITKQSKLKSVSLLFSLIVKDKVTDTLCGTKAFYRKDWKLFEDFGEKTNNFDKWGDFNIIFGSVSVKSLTSF